MSHDSLTALCQRIQETNRLTPADQEDLRGLVRTRALADLFFFNRFVVGFPDLSPTLHGELCRELMAPDRFKLIELPRQHLKTSNATIGYGLWRICRQPLIRILIRSATEKNAGDMLQQCQAVILRKPVFRWLFPELIPRDFQKVRWNQTELEIQRAESFQEATMEAFGGGGTAVSRHYNLILEDDMINEDHLLSAVQMGKQIDEHKRGLSLMVDPSKDERLTVANRWAFDDLNSHIIEHEPWVRRYHRAALEPMPAGHPCEAEAAWPGLAPIWPERFTKETLGMILEAQGPHMFSCLYMNDPVHDNARAFNPDWFRFFVTLPSGPLSYYTAVDPAIGTTNTSDFTAMVTVGMDPHRMIYVVDARHDRWGVDEWIDHLFEVQRTYHSVVGIEATAFQKVLQYPLREAMRRHNYTFPIMPLKHGNAPKYSKLRIGGLQEYFNNGSISMRREQTALIDQLRRVGGRLQHDDLADALAYAVQQMAIPAAEMPQENQNPLLLENILKGLREQKTAHNSIWTWHRPPNEVRA